MSKHKNRKGITFPDTTPGADPFLAQMLRRQAERPSILREGEPCQHPGCASHVSEPCEGCGRYAAGLMNGPEPQVIASRLREIARNHTAVHAVLVTAQMQGWTLEQTFGALSLLLVRENETLVQMVIREMQQGGGGR